MIEELSVYLFTSPSKFKYRIVLSPKFQTNEGNFSKFLHWHKKNCKKKK